MSYQPKYQHRQPRRRRRGSGIGSIVALLLAVAILGTTAYLLVREAREPVITVTEPGDTVPPEIAGVQDLLLYEGDTVSYRAGVTVTDDVDAAPELTVDSSAVDLTRPGSYTLTYIATDTAGNRTTATVTVTVLEMKEHYQTLETIYQAADSLLAEIIKPDMGQKQQVRAIYRWARQNITYSGHSDRADWRQTAYTVLQERTGDCYGYFAVTKLLFERLEIPNIDVRKVKNHPDDSDHFWSMVSIDGGNSYYHFDATPRVGDGDDFCLVTDLFLDAYSEEHNGSHNRDKSLYPKTP